MKKIANVYLTQTCAFRTLLGRQICGILSIVIKRKEVTMNMSRKITDDIIYLGVSDYRLNLFENLFPLENGVSYNSYLLLDEKTVLFDTVDYAVG